MIRMRVEPKINITGTGNAKQVNTIKVLTIDLAKLYPAKANEFFRSPLVNSFMFLYHSKQTYPLPPNTSCFKPADLMMLPSFRSSSGRNLIRACVPIFSYASRLTKLNAPIPTKPFDLGFLAAHGFRFIINMIPKVANTLFRIFDLDMASGNIDK